MRSAIAGQDLAGHVERHRCARSAGRVADLVKQLDPPAVAQHVDAGCLGPQAGLGGGVVGGRVAVLDPAVSKSTNRASG